MSRYKGWRARLRGLLRRKAADRDVDDEMGFHLAMETEKNVQLGRTPSEARRRALLVFGGTERFKEAHRDARRLNRLEDLVRDLRFGLRAFVRAPLFAVTAMLTLAVAIGTCAIVFSMVNGMILRPFPVHDPERLVALWATDQAEGTMAIGWDDYVSWRSESGVFSDLAAVQMAPLSIGGAGSDDAPADLLWSELVTPNYFSVLGLRPAAGRFFTASETAVGSEPRVVISHAHWQARFGGARDVIGQSVLVNGEPATLIGVAPASFHGARRFGFWPDAWIAFGVRGTETKLSGRGAGPLITIGRLPPGVTRERAQVAVNLFAQRLAQAYPASNRDIGATLTSARAPFDNPRYVPPRVLTLASTISLVAVGLVLLVACANVANLMLARASAREREISIRLAIGGTRMRLIRQLLAESSLLALGGGALGMAVSIVAAPLSRLLVPKLQFTVGIDASIDHRVVLFTAAIAIASVFLFGLAPALSATRMDLVNGLKGESPRTRRTLRVPALRDVLVGVQLAVSVVLLVAGGLFIRSLTAMRTVDLGVEVDGRVMVSVNPGMSGYDDARARQFYRAVKQRVNALPDVQSAAWGFPVPFDTYGRGLDLYVEGVTDGHGDQTFSVEMSVVDADFFRTLGTPLLEGRDFAPYDTTGAPLVMIVSRALARRFWQNESPVGKRVRLGGPNGGEVQIVGMVENAVYQSPTQPPPPRVFLAMRQHAASNMGLTLVTHSRHASAATLARIRGVVHETDPRVAAYGAITMQRAVRNAMSPQESAAVVSAVLGGIALLLASIGLYGLVAYTVDRRKREVGIRMALGASRTAVLGMMLRRTARTALIGIGVGLVIASAVGRLIASMLYQVAPFDPIVFATVALVLVGVVLLGSYVPARRAARVDPISTLRAD
jgi:predicted permease